MLMSRESNVGEHHILETVSDFQMFGKRHDKPKIARVTKLRAY
jgi:hypothetical protein